MRGPMGRKRDAETPGRGDTELRGNINKGYQGIRGSGYQEKNKETEMRGWGYGKKTEDWKRNGKMERRWEDGKKVRLTWSLISGTRIRRSDGTENDGAYWGIT